MNLRFFSPTSILAAHVETHLGAHIGTLISILFWASLAYWNYRQATRKGTWAWSRVFLLMGAVAVFVCGFILPLARSKTMAAHLNLTFGIMMGGMVALVGLLYYFFTKYPVKPREQVTAPSSTDSASDINRPLIVVFAIFCASGSLAQTPVHAETLYKDPAGLFTARLPANWRTQQEPGSQMVSFFEEKSQAFVYMGVIRKNEANTPTADAELEKVQAHLAGNCPQAKIQERGSTTLGGIHGAFFRVHCTNNKGELEVMKFSVASKPGVLVVVTNASPVPTYETALSDIDSIEHSVRLLTSTAQAQPIQQGQPAETSQASVQSSSSAPSGSGMYRDPRGRYSLTVPDGWSAEPQADSGALQLSSGPNWAMLVTGSGGEPREVNHQITQQIQAQFTDFQLLNEGDLQINGHPSHGTNATGVNPKGERASVLVLSISAGSGKFLTVISSSPNDQAKTINATIMQMAQSIRFGGK